MAFNGLEFSMPLGYEGIVTDLPAAELPRSALLEADNVVITKGYVQKAPGGRRYNSAAFDGRVCGFTDWWPTEISQRVIAVTDNGSVYRDNGPRTFNGNVPIKTGLVGVTPDVQFVQGGNESTGRDRKLFLFTGQNQVQVLSGDSTTMRNITSPAADWNNPNTYPVCGIVHRNRLWAFRGSQAYASTTGDHEDFANVNSILLLPVAPGEGGDILGCYLFVGKLLVFKRDGFIYELIDTDIDSSNWFFVRFAKGITLSAPNAIAQVGNDTYIGNSNNSLTSLATTQSFGDIQQTDVYQQLRNASYFRKKLHVSSTRHQHALYYENKNTTYFTGKSASGTNNNRLIVIDNNAGRPRITTYSKDAPVSLGSIRDVNRIERPFYGTPDGYIMSLDRETRLVHTGGYTGQFKTPHYDFRELDPRLASMSKNYAWMQVEYYPEGRWDLLCDVIIDGKFMETITFPMSEYADSELDAMETDVGQTLALNNQTSIVRPLHGSGTRIGFVFRNAGASQSFQIASFTVGFKPAGKLPHRGSQS